ncbi:MAG: amidohydrolase family protein [Methanophagales archaeon]|nr:amidohydrolase family protein [Methanophagales archaeon]
MTLTCSFSLSGIVVAGDDFEAKDGYLVIEDGKIKEIEDNRKNRKIDAAIEGIIIPAFVNAHTHIGDSVLKEPEFMPLEQLVGPGGFKHRILGAATYGALVSAMNDTIEDMLATGTQIFADFREGGLPGVLALRAVLCYIERKKQEQIGVKIFGSPVPDSVEVDRTGTVEVAIDKLLKAVDGIGMSSVADYPLEAIKLPALEAKRMNKMFALHAGERTAEDIADAIELEPDFLVHLIKASHQDFKKMYDADIAAVVCIRSNLVTGSGLPPLQQMLESGLTVGAGTDNVMLNSPDMFSEMEFISKIFRSEAKDVLKMCTLDSAAVLKESESVGSIEEGKKANLVVIRTDTANMRNVSDPVKGVVRRARRTDIAAVIHEGRIVGGRSLKVM